MTASVAPVRIYDILEEARRRQRVIEHQPEPRAEGHEGEALGPEHPAA
jgi:hypothetical protein